MAVELGVNVITNPTGDTLPLIIEPSNPESSTVEFLKEWVTDNTDTISNYLTKYGAILFRGFPIEKGIHFQEVVQSYDDLSDEYRGTSPRTLIPGTQFVFSASELPPYYPIPQHIEMSFLPEPPRRLFFCCLEAPTSLGGETSLCDFKKVYERLDPSVREKFESKGVTYIRNYPRKKSFFSNPLLMKGWELVFGTTDKEVVERELRGPNINFEWSKDDHLRISNKAAAIETHPVTGDKIWFNHLAVFHWSMMYQEFNHIYKRLRQVYYLIFSWLMWILQISFVATKGPKSMAMHTTFGDGTEIPLADVNHVRETMYKNMVFNRWRKGDLLMIDNFRISHGRQPYTGKRKIVVSWSKPQLKPSFKQSETTN